MNLIELERIVPAAFAIEPDPNVSNAYEFIPTLPIVHNLLERGWVVRSAHQNRKQVDAFASHRIVFDVPNAPRHKEVGEVWPTATLFNSHNRTRRLSFSVGFFRTWCSNQCQTSVLSTDTSKIHIIGWGGLNLDDVLKNMMDQFGQLPTTMNRMKETPLPPAGRIDFGKRALSLKSYGDDSQRSLYNNRTVSDFLTPKRAQDAGDDLWSLFNVAQENALHGSSRGVQEVGRNRNLNLSLWNLATSYLNN